MRRFGLFAIALLTCAACRVPTSRAAAATSTSSAAAPGTAYREQHRPLFHFTPPAKWMNDPNGMVYFDGEYHLFYQYYPDSTVWGPMHWGHAVSTDLVKWQQLPIALFPDSLGLIFSGSAVVDSLNTSGFGVNGEPPMVAVFTYHNMAREKAGETVFQTQGIAYSTDRGRSWTKYAQNPVLQNPGLRDMRDPKVFWHAATQRWIMILAAGDQVRLFASYDLKQWTQVSTFGRDIGAHGGVWECPDLFPIKVEGTNDTRWVMLVSMNPGAPNGGSGTQYFVGTFDGVRFTLDSSFARGLGEAGKESTRGIWVDHGRDNYAGVTWSGIPSDDGRRLFLGWMSNWDYATVVPTAAWRSAMTLPRALTLHATPAGPRLYSTPVKELRALRDEGTKVGAQRVGGSMPLTFRRGGSAASAELDLEFLSKPGAASTVSIELKNAGGEIYRIGYDAAARQFFSDRTALPHAFSDRFAAAVHRAPRIASDSIVRMHLYFDRASVELFADGGATAMTDIMFPAADFESMRLVVQGESIGLRYATLYGLRSIW
jgi:fructan beta-fructosidase